MDSILSAVIDNVSWATALLALGVCILFYFYIQWAHMPPGPTGLPYLGYYPFLRDDFHVQLHDMVKKYGDVFIFKCIGQEYVCLGSERAVREAHVTKSDCFAGRSRNFTLLGNTFDEGVGFENGEKWKDLRRFFIQRLKEFGLGKVTQESLMGNYLQKSVDVMRQKEGENFDAVPFFTQTCSRAIYTLLLGGTKVDDEDIRIFNEAYAAVAETTILSKITLAGGPLLKYVLLYTKPELRRYRKYKLLLETMLMKIVQEHEKNFDRNNIRDIIDSYIKERKDMAEKEDPKSKTFSDKTLVASLIQIIGDSGFSVGMIICYALRELVLRPDVQKEIQQEIDDIVGSSRLPSWDDRSRMPYTNAVLFEIFRISNFFPTFPSLECTKETTIGDCRVPKGAITLVNFWAIFHNADMYNQPDKFDPTRFLLNEDHKPKSELPVFFGVGKRSCIGESLVIMETFLFVTTILQNFDLHPAKEQEADEKVNADMNIVFRATARTS